MSKINELRRKATEAARKRDWKSAVKLYEKVCEIDSANASFRNELGDIYLKMGEVHQALDAFARAAELYRSVSLHNNAVAVLKKVLRHDKNHLDATWGLGEVREAQGLDLEAQQHFGEFLSMADMVDANTRQRFTNRCVLLVEKYGDDLQMLSRVESVFEGWNLAEDHARVLMQKACLAHDEGQGDLVDKYVEKARGIYPDLDTLDDYVELMVQRTGDAAAAKLSGAVDFTDSESESLGEAAGEIELSFELDGAEIAMPEVELDGADVNLPETEPDAVDESPVEAEPAPEADLDSTAVAETEPEQQSTGPDLQTLSQRIDLSNIDADSLEGLGAPPVAPAPGAAPSATEAAPDPQQLAADSASLLDELLSEDGDFDFASRESQQVTSIETDLGDQIAAQVAPDDYAGQYDVGLVYMEMGLYDQAAEAFGRASCGPEQRLKGLEMQGTCLRKAGRNGEALAAFQDGLNTEGAPDRHFLGLLYEVGVCFEEMGQQEHARAAFLRAATIDGSFRDLTERLSRLAAPTT